MDYIPKKGFIGRWFNPHPFNHKEHAAILIMSSTAAHSAMAAEVIAVQRLWYTKIPNAAVCIFLIFSSQVMGYGIAGLMRKIIVYPTKVHPQQNLSIKLADHKRTVLLPRQSTNHVSSWNSASKEEGRNKTPAQDFLLGFRAYLRVGSGAWIYDAHTYWSQYFLLGQEEQQ